VATRVAARSDAGAIATLIGTCELANDGVAEVHATDAEHAFDVAGDGGVIVVEAPDGLVGWASVQGDRAEADVHPAWRGRGIGSQLLAWTEARARLLGNDHVRQVVTDADHAAHRLFEGAGYATGPISWILELAWGDAVPEVLIPAGIGIRQYDPAHARATYRVIEDAFNEWPGREPTTFDSWSAHVLAHAAFSPTHSRVAFEGDELVGAAISYDYEGEDEGWVGQLATRRSHRQRGIARALLQAVAIGFHATGRRRIGLSTNSRSGALTVYERIGMTVRRSYTGWLKELSEGLSG
jgi:GNAT superfamily N-acetyltransferase